MNHATNPQPTDSNPGAKLWVSWWFRSAKWQQSIRTSGLPTAAQHLLLGLVAGTGLMRDEKLEVADELVAHFQDGIQRGQGISQLIDDFGDPSLVATLIRKGKQRNRNMKNRLAQASMWLGALSGGGFLVLAIVFYFGKPNPSTDYLALINQPILEVPDDQKGWTIYRDLWIKYGFSEGGEGQFNEIHFTDGEGITRMVRSSDGDAWQKAIKKLASAEDLLEGFRTGGVRPSFGVAYHADPANYSREDFQALFPTQVYPGDSSLKTETSSPFSKSMVMVLLPHVQVMRKAACLLVVDTRWAIEQNDSERAVRNTEALLGLSSQVTESKFLVSGLVGLAIEALTLDSIDELLVSKIELTAVQMERIQSAIEKCQTTEYISLASERAGVMDMIQRTYSDDGNGDGRLTAEGLRFWNQYLSISSVGQPEINAQVEDWSSTFGAALQATIAPASLLIMATRKQLTDQANKLFDQYEEYLDKPYSDNSIQQVEQELDALDSGYVLLKMLFPATRMLRQAYHRLAGQRGGAIAGLAILRYKQDHGRFPGSLAELQGKYLKEVPVDPIDLQPLRYKLQDNGFIIYSIGVDQVDDGGRSASRPTDPATETNTSRASKSFDPMPAGEYRFELMLSGDWILWPRHSHARDR